MIEGERAVKCTKKNTINTRTSGDMTVGLLRLPPDQHIGIRDLASLHEEDRKDEKRYSDKSPTGTQVLPIN